METIYLVAGKRSPMGKYGGGLASLRATEIASVVAEVTLATAGVPPTAVQGVVGGMVLQDMSESNPARIVGQRIGLPDRAPAFTVNMQCASGLAAFVLAAQQIATGRADCMLAVGMESMTNPPYSVRGARWGMRGGHGEFTDTLEECKLAGSAMWGDPWTMIDVAEHHAKIDGISRSEMDDYAVLTHTRAVDAARAGQFGAEVVPIEVQTRTGTVVVTEDENPRPGISLEQLARLRPIRPGGTITAGNASAHSDGAAAAVLCSAAVVAELGLRPLAQFNLADTALVGCDPHLMGYSAVDAAESALKSADMTLDQVDLIECNEGFAVQMLACERLGKWASDRLNVDGGSVALGHPVGASGLRIVVHLAHALKQRDLRHGLATVPAGSGLGSAIVLRATA